MTQPPIEFITQTIVEALHPRRIILFGSRARGGAEAHSDIDLMIEMETSEPPARRIRSIDALFGLRTRPMDLIVYTPEEVRQQRRYRNSLIRRVESEGRVLYEQS